MGKNGKPMEKKDQTYLYQKIVREFECKIKNGSYKPGERLPSIRSMKSGLHVSISTIYKVYTELERLGMVEARPRSGYFVKVTSTLGVPQIKKPDSRPRPVSLSTMVIAVLNDMNNPGMLQMGSSTISPDLLPYKHFARILKGIGPNGMKKLMDYSLAAGDLELRRQIARHSLGVMKGIGPEDIIVTNGCMDAVTLALMAITRPGDTVVIDSPTHFGFLQLLQELGLMAMEVPSDPRFGTDIAGLEQVLKQGGVKACVLVSSFQNPTGALMPVENRKKLVTMTNRYGVPVIEDNVFSELYFGTHRPISLKMFDRKELVVACSSFSKTLAPGLRIGWMIPGTRYYNSILNLKSGTSLATSTLDQYVLAKFLSSGSYERFMRGLRAGMKKQVMQTAMAIQSHFPGDTRLALPGGGALLWVELNKRVNALDLYYEARKHDISITPGMFFSVSRNFNHYVRLGCGFPYTDKTERGIKKLGEILSS